MNKLTKIVNEILKTEKKCIGYELRCSCCEGKLRKNNVCVNCEEEVAPKESVNYPVYDYKEIYLEDLLLALGKKDIDGNISVEWFGNSLEVMKQNDITIVVRTEIELKNPLSKQKPAVIKKLIEILL